MATCSIPDGQTTKWAEVVDSISSSYKQNNYGQLFYDIVRLNRPERCVEIGVSFGYSTMHIAAALRDNQYGFLWAYDLFRDEPIVRTVARLANLELLVDWMALHQLHATDVPDRQTLGVNFVHIDIGNDGRTYLWAAQAFGTLLSPDGILVLEGGTAERDALEWMARDNCMPIREALKQLASDWHIFTFQAFPGLTIMRQR